jgi:AAA15 family ATPase/GTPase
MKMKPITLIAGRNNTGKSSILDGLFLFQEYADPDVFLRLAGFRGVRQIDVSSRNLWEPLFYNMDTKEAMILRVNGDSILQLEKNKGFALSNSGQNIIEGKIDFHSANYALSCVFKRGSESFSGYYLIGNEKQDKAVALFSHTQAALMPNDIYTQYLGPNITLSENVVAGLFGQVELSPNDIAKKKLLSFLEMLGGFISDIKIIFTSGLPQLYFTNKQGIKMPVYIMGDGIRKLLHIALIMLTKPGCILLLDEVENGLHYSLHAKFWEMISTLATQEQCQIVATTHSYECISGALEGIKLANQEDNFAYVRLDKDGGTVVPKSYDSDMLERALDKDWEVR